ncbi:MAG: M48 family metalloprotease [Bdellovibrionota bacterium]
MKKQLSTLALISLFAISLSSCGANDQNSKLQHDTNSPVTSIEKGQWVNLSEDEFDNFIIPYTYPGSPSLPSNHKLVQKAKNWIAKIDNQLRQKHPDLLRSVPTPKTKVIQNESANAFVASAFICFDIEADLPQSGDSIDALYLDIADGQTYKWPEGISCVDRSNVKLLQDALNRFNNRGNDCRFSLHKGVVTVGTACKNGDTEDVSNAKRVVIPQTADWITITTKLFETMETEESFVAVIAHELGHYYKAHSLRAEKEYGYYYKIGAENPNHRPSADPKVQIAGEEAYKGAETLGVLSNFVGIDTQTLHSALYFAAGDLAYQRCKQGSCSQACSKVAKLAESKSFIEKMGLFPFQETDDSTYRAFEKKAQQCLQEIPFNTNSQNNSDWEKIISSVKTPEWNPISTLISERGVELVNGWLGNVAGTLTKPTSEDNYFEALEELSKQLNNSLNSSYQALKTAKDLRLGQYTSEQEADELAGEWLTDIGVNAKSVGDAFIFLGAGRPNSLGGFLYGGEKCKELRDRDWKDKNGDDIFVPIGDYSEIHHSSCFRAYNADREVTAHHYDVNKNAKITLSDDSSWKDIQTTASTFDYPTTTRNTTAISAATSSSTQRQQKLRLV